MPKRNIDNHRKRTMHLGTPTDHEWNRQEMCDPGEMPPPAWGRDEDFEEALQESFRTHVEGDDAAT